MAITTYCSWADVAARVSADAANLRTDDNPAARRDVLESAAVEVNGYLQLRYSVTTLARSTWVRFKTRDVAVYLLCLRRNHPPPKSVEARYEQAVKDFEKIQSGAAMLPDVAEDKENVPVLSNQRVKLTPFPRVQNQDGNSTGTREGYSPNNDGNTFDYGTN